MIIPSDSFSVGPLTIYWYSVFIGLSIVAGYFLARPQARRIGLTDHQLQASILYGLFPGIIGARAYHVIDQWSLYADQPWQALALWNGGLAILGGLAGGGLGLWLFSRHSGHSLLRVLDVWAPSVLLGQTLGRFGNWTNQEAFGLPTEGPFKVFISPEHRPEQYAGSAYFHPTFFYEATYDAAGLAVLLLLVPKLRRHPGRVVGTYLVIYAVGRFLVEFYRFDTAHISGVAVAHVVAAGLAILGIWLLARPSQPVVE